MANSNRLLTLDDLFKEGKHKGKTVKEVCLEDPKWVDKVESNETYRFTNSVMFYLEEILNEI